MWKRRWMLCPVQKWQKGWYIIIPTTLLCTAVIFGRIRKHIQMFIYKSLIYYSHKLNICVLTTTPRYCYANIWHRNNEWVKSCFAKFCSFLLLGCSRLETVQNTQVMGKKPTICRLTLDAFAMKSVDGRRECVNTLWMFTREHWPTAVPSKATK